VLDSEDAAETGEAEGALSGWVEVKGVELYVNVVSLGLEYTEMGIQIMPIMFDRTPTWTSTLLCCTEMLDQHTHH
jgi:hypothetical protein